MYQHSRVARTSTNTRHEPHRYLSHASEINLATTPSIAGEPAVARCSHSCSTNGTYLSLGPSTEPSQTMQVSRTSMPLSSQQRSQEPQGQSGNSNRPRCFEHGCGGREFSNMHNYRRHLRERNGSKSTQCPWCSTKFTRRSNLDTHLASGRCRKLSEAVCEDTLLTDSEVECLFGMKCSVDDSDAGAPHNEVELDCVDAHQLSTTDNNTDMLQADQSWATVDALDWNWEQSLLTQ